MMQFEPDQAHLPGALFHTRTQLAAFEWQQELDARSWEADTRHWREELGDISCAEAERIEAACARKGAGLVSVSTTAKRAAPSRAGLSPVHRARAKRRADSTPGLYMPTGDEASMRVRHLRRAVGFAARAHGVSRDGFRPDVCKMLTLTYADASAWRPEHVKRLLDRYRSWLRAKNIPCRYVWVAELQKRGAIHYHIALFVPHGTKVPYPDAAGWWKHGCTNVEEARAAVPYLMKYLSKGGDKAGAWRLPQGARMYGVGGVEHSLRRARRWLALPAFVRSRADISDDWRRAPGGGWVDPDGVIWPSEYRRARVGCFLAFERLHDHGRPFDPAGPFSWLPAPGAPQ